MSKFSDKFKELRKSRNLSQQQLADYLHTSKSSVNMYERGEREPGLEMLEAIADYFNVDMDYLLGKAEVANKALFNNPPLKLPNGDEQELLTIYRNVNQEGKDYIMQTARMVGDTERYQIPDIRLKHARSADDHGAEYVEVTPEERKRLDEAPDETQNPDNDI